MPAPLADEFGGYGLEDVDHRDTGTSSRTWFAQIGRHAVHGALELTRSANLRDTVFDGGLLHAGGVAAGRVHGRRPDRGSSSHTRFDPTNGRTTTECATAAANPSTSATARVGPHQNEDAS